MAVLGGMEFCSARRAKVNNPAIHRWGAVATGKVRRDERMGRLGRQEAKRHFFRPYGTFFVLGSGSEMNRCAIFARPSAGTSGWDPFVPCPGQPDDDPNPFHRNKRGIL